MKLIRIIFIVMALLTVGGTFVLGSKGCLWQKDDSTSGSSGPWRMINPSPWIAIGPYSVWTGNPAEGGAGEIIMWGGVNIDIVPIVTGIKYAPISNTWSTISTIGAPAPRVSHTLVWTGNPPTGTGEMLVWGGAPLANAGGRYNRATDTWQPITTTGEPLYRKGHTAIWTGQEMIVWGGETSGVGYSNDGGRYNPLTDTWAPITTTNAPATRTSHTAIWTGTEMIVWGG